MIIPIRCFTCGSVLADKWIKYQDLCKDFRSETNETDIEVLDIDALNSEINKHTAEWRALRDLQVHRICCRRHFLCNVDMIDII
tara:strand:+ start:1818 stop:2069 length:252 start_codon:yes stop_codon:yes gene_type:complete